MKKTVAVILAVCICVSVMVMLASCSHEHEYKAEWVKDDTHHWHACKTEGCNEISGKAEHVWDDGEDVTQATPQADGTKIFTCTACKYTKTETVKYAPKFTVSEAEWRAALDKQLFYNVTMEYKEYSYDDETSIAECRSTSILEYDGNIMRSGKTVRENIPENDMSTDEISNIIGKGAERFSNAQYDAEKQRYTVMAYDEYYDMQCGLVYQFTDGKLVSFEFHFLDEGSLENMYKIQWIQLGFSKYGTTVIN